MLETAKRVEVSAAIIRRGRQVMLAQRPPESRHAGKWEFPGGKLEAGETPESCLLRELEEELDFTVRDLKIIFTCDHKRDDGVCLRLFFIECFPKDGADPQLAEEQRIVWADPNDLFNYDLLEPDRVAAEFLVSLLD